MQGELIWKSRGRTLWNELESQADNEGEAWKEKAFNDSKVLAGVPRGEWGRGRLKGKDENYKIKPKTQDTDTGKYERSYGFYESSNKNKNESETKESS